MDMLEFFYEYAGSRWREALLKVGRERKEMRALEGDSRVRIVKMEPPLVPMPGAGGYMFEATIRITCPLEKLSDVTRTISDDLRDVIVGPSDGSVAPSACAFIEYLGNPDDESHSDDDGYIVCAKTGPFNWRNI